MEQQRFSKQLKVTELGSAAPEFVLSGIQFQPVLCHHLCAHRNSRDATSLTSRHFRGQALARHPPTGCPVRGPSCAYTGDGSLSAQWPPLEHTLHPGPAAPFLPHPSPLPDGPLPALCYKEGRLAMNLIYNECPLVPNRHISQLAIVLSYLCQHLFPTGHPRETASQNDPEPEGT